MGELEAFARSDAVNYDAPGAALSPAQAEEAMRRAATAAANVPRAAHLYQALPPVDYQPQQPHK